MNRYPGRVIHDSTDAESRGDDNMLAGRARAQALDSSQDVGDNGVSSERRGCRAAIAPDYASVAVNERALDHCAANVDGDDDFGHDPLSQPPRRESLNEKDFAARQGSVPCSARSEPRVAGS